MLGHKTIKHFLDIPIRYYGMRVLKRKEISETLLPRSKSTHSLTRLYSSFRAEPKISPSLTAATTLESKLAPKIFRNYGSIASVGTDALRSREEVDAFLKDLSENQRRLLYQQLHVEVLTEKYMNELASESHYLSKFGRPCSRGAEDHGTFVELPPKWLANRMDMNQQDDTTADEAKAQSKHVAVGDLWSVGVKNALPFVGFGFLDNLIMILAGDYIDLTIGAALGISTMAAAALGNTISDVAGIASVWYVEHFAERFGIPEPNLTAAQLASTPVRWTANIGRALGVIIGCLLGMVPLFFLKTSDEKKEAKDAKEAET